MQKRLLVKKKKKDASLHLALSALDVVRDGYRVRWALGVLDSEINVPRGMRQSFVLGAPISKRRHFPSCQKKCLVAPEWHNPAFFLLFYVYFGAKFLTFHLTINPLCIYI